MKHAASNFMVFLQMLTIQNDSWWEFVTGNDWGLERSIVDICMCVCMAAVCEAGCQTWNMFLCIGVLLCITVQLSRCQLMFHWGLHAVKSLLCVITTLQSQSYLLVMPRPSEAVWGVGSSCVLRLLKTLVWQAAFPCRACHLPSPIMFSSCWWNAKAYGKQVVILWDRFLWPSVVRFLVNQCSLPFAQRVSETGRAGRRCDW